MDGRIYDPTLGRFLQADPIIQAPNNSQSYNRFSYVFNNPMSYTDPSGFSAWTNFRDKVLKPAIAIGIAIYTGGAASGLLSYGMYSEAAIAIAMGGFSSGAVLTGTLKGAVTGAATSLVFFGIGQGFSAGSGFWTQNGAGHIGSHALAGGILSDLQGGKFGHGFISAGLTKAISVNAIIGVAAQDAGSRIVTAAALGGTISHFTGGKFANGAITAAFAQAFNGEGQAKRTRWAEFKDWLKEVDLYGGVVLRGVASPPWDGKFVPYMADAHAGLTFDPDLVYSDSGLITGLDMEIGGTVGGSYNADGYGLSFGRSVEGGLTWVPAETLAVSQMFNIDTPIGGISFVTSPNVDSLRGIIFGGPSLGFSFSATTPQGSGAVGATFKERRE